MAKTVVILGGSYAGAHVAHYVLKNTTDTKVVLVSKNSHFYWNMASVRAVIPDTFDDSQLFAPLTDFFSRYPKDRVEVVVGAAEKVDTDAKTVVVATSPSRTLAYDQLVIATGAHSTVPADGSIAVPWKADGTYEDIVALLAATRSKVAAAQHIVVAGGGLTGTEVAADLGHSYGRKPADKGGKTIVLLSATPVLLGGDSLAGTVSSAIKGFGVDVRTGQKVTGVRALPDGKTELTLTASGAGAAAAEPTTLVTDLYLPAVGNAPNSAFLDPQLLRADGFVRIDAFYRAAAVPSNDVWALGDVVGVPRCSFIYTQKQAAGVGKNVVLALQGKPPAVVKLLPVDPVTISLGPDAGAGRMSWLRLPGFVVANLKSRRLGTQMLPDYVSGKVA